MKVHLTHTKFYVLFLLNSGVGFCFCDFIFYSQPKQYVPPYLSIADFFINLPTEGILFPKKKASGALLLEILGERQIKL